MTRLKLWLTRLGVRRWKDSEGYWYRQDGRIVGLGDTYQTKEADLGQLIGYVTPRFSNDEAEARVRGVGRGGA